MLTAVELQLANSCGTSSFRFTNSHGTFQTTRALSLKFIGKMTLSGSAPPIQLDLAPVLEALKYAKSAADVDRILQTVTGSF